MRYLILRHNSTMQMKNVKVKRISMTMDEKLSILRQYGKCVYPGEPLEKVPGSTQHEPAVPGHLCVNYNTLFDRPSRIQGTSAVDSGYGAEDQIPGVPEGWRSWGQMQSFMEDRAPGSEKIIGKVLKLSGMKNYSMRFSKRIFYSPEAVQYVKEHMPPKGAVALSKLFPGMSRTTHISSRLAAIGYMPVAEFGDIKYYFPEAVDVYYEAVKHAHKKMTKAEATRAREE